ncbi:MAG: LytTR family DNA-binding domain-containing protein, partial [Panacibacter sp.]
VEAATWLQKKPIDLIFLDIQMPKLTGIDFLKNLSAPPLVIFTTAYPEYAIEGYELDVLDYLLKPISFSRFLKAALKAQDYVLKNKRGLHVSDDYFFIKSNQKLEKINMADVLYIEGMNNYIVVHTKQKKHIAYLTFKGIEEKLPQHLFVRTHKSFLVSINAIQTIDTNEVTLETGTLPISKSYRDEVIGRIGERLFKR